MTNDYNEDESFKLSESLYRARVISDWIAATKGDIARRDSMKQIPVYKNIIFCFHTSGKSSDEVKTQI